MFLINIALISWHYKKFPGLVRESLKRRKPYLLQLSRQVLVWHRIYCEQKNNVIKFKPVNERICKFRLRGRHDINIICIHAPTKDKENSDKETFYDTSENTLEECPQSDMKLLIGDFNVKTVKKINDIKTNLLEQSLQQVTRENGEFLINFASANDLRISGTMFQQKNIHKARWMSPNRKTCNQIDHILIDLRH